MSSRIRVGVKKLLVMSIVMLALTNAGSYFLLLTRNKEWKDEITKIKYDNTVQAEALVCHVYYDGDSIPLGQMVSHYDRFGKLIERKEFKEVMRGDKVVFLLSTNSCSTCAKDAISSLLELSNKIGSKRVVMVSDFAIHKQRSWTVIFGPEGFYETDLEHLGLIGSPTREEAVVMLVQDGRVKTSFPVMPQSKAFANGFYGYLLDYFKERK